MPTLMELQCRVLVVLFTSKVLCLTDEAIIVGIAMPSSGSTVYSDMQGHSLTDKAIIAGIAMPCSGSTVYSIIYLFVFCLTSKSHHYCNCSVVFWWYCLQAR